MRNKPTKTGLLEKLIKYEAHQSQKVDRWGNLYDTSLLKETIKYLKETVLVIPDNRARKLIENRNNPHDIYNRKT